MTRTKKRIKATPEKAPKITRATPGRGQKMTRVMARASIQRTTPEGINE
jgi:hypothetical protein